MDTFIRDLTFAVRTLKRQPAFTFTAVLTIALGIGATTAIFSVVNTVLLRPLPYSDAARLGTIWADLRNRNVVDFPISPGDFHDLRTVLTQFEAVAGLNSFRPTVGGDGQGDAEQVFGAGVTTNLLDVLGHRIHVGRGFVEDDGRPNAAAPLPAAGAPP
ncbi:MAG: ABC transporter permease, partial [Vicinamibacterales bacterium]